MVYMMRQVSASKDDVYRRMYPSAFSYADAIVRVGYYSSSSYRWGAGFRWLDIPIPPGSTIVSAKLRVCAYTTQTASTVNTRIRGEAADNPLTFSTSGNFDARPRTTSIDWDNVPAMGVNSWYLSPEFKEVIQEIVDRPGWEAGNAIVLFWDDFDNRSTHASNRYRNIWAWNGSVSKAAKLEITYLTYDPPTVTTQEASLISPEQGTLHGTITASEVDCDERGFDWDYDSGEPYANSWTETDSYGLGAFSHQLTGLTPGATVYYRAKARNPVGWGYGPEKFFRVPIVIELFQEEGTDFRETKFGATWGT